MTTTWLLTAAGKAAAQTASITLTDRSDRVVRYGESVRLSGRTVPGAPGRVVRLEHAPRKYRWRVLARTAIRADGSYRFTLRPRRSGHYRVVGDSGATAARRLTVVARLLGGRASRHVRSGSHARVRGRLAPGFGGRKVRLQLRTGRGWRTVDRAVTGRGGRFRAAWRTTRPGRFRLRVRFGGDRRNAAVSRALRKRVHAYRPSSASWYGPGLYGNRLACGGVLGYDTLGVAHRSLPCGTRVTFRYGGRSVTVPVVDRGPFAGGREWDLTSATKRRLGFRNLGTLMVAY